MAAQATEGLKDLKVSDDSKPNGANEKPTANGDDEEHGDDSEDEADDGTAPATGAAKKKKNKKKKKKKKNPSVQSEPPRVPLKQLFANKPFPVGQEVEYLNENAYRTTDEEKRHLDNLNSDFLQDYREAAEVHRQVRQYAKKTIRPGQSLIEIAENIEDSVRALVGHQGLEEGDALKAGMGFPVGLSRNEIAAHYNPNSGNKMVLDQNDVMKVDIGVHVNGRIVDSAFTVAFESKYDNLLKAVQEATEAGVKEAGIDARVGEIGGIIQETMESYEIELDGQTYPIKSIRNLTGHNILPYSIHGTKAVPIVKSNDQTKMEEGDVFAIETFGSTGNGYVRDDLECSHYAKVGDAHHADLRLSSAKSLLNVINKNFGTLPFCRRFLDRLGQEKYLLGLNSLVNNGIVEAYPPLVDKKGSYTAQFEHTILIRPNVKEVISRGDDY
ncbi:metallopeptidase family m24 domain-containing protein [Sarocladium implicatum]|nr:metallopeptidase family m24 domain-containing protein [Sarocladium implicatum]